LDAPETETRNGRDGSDAHGAAEALHDVGNALTVVLGWLDQAIAQADDPAFAVRALGIARQKARDARDLARSAIGARTEPRAMEPTCAATLARDVVDTLSLEIERAGLTLELHAPEDDAWVADDGWTGHALTNLLLNAIAFTPRGGAIRVSVGVTDGASDPRRRRVVLTVSDDGPGVAPEVLPRLFDGASARPGGAGVGLRHTREVARRLGGDLVHVPGGRGATFRLELPRVATPYAPTSRRSVAPPPPTSEAVDRPTRVLVIEDDRAVCALLDAGLGARGMEVVALHDGRGLANRLPAIARDGRIDAVLLDLSPIADDLAGALSALQSVAPDAGIVFISGSVVALEQDLLAAVPRARWVRKPFELAEVAKAIVELIPR
jgi:CheY-like chemotaxis protein/two-component sensor histidine kinase